MANSPSPPQTHLEYPSPAADTAEVRRFLLEIMRIVRGGDPADSSSEHAHFSQKFTGDGLVLYRMTESEMKEMFGPYGEPIFQDLHHRSPWGMVSNNICHVCSLLQKI